jgi:hypothetical protein
VLWNSSLAALLSWAIACLFIVSLKCDLRQPWLEYNVQCNGLVSMSHLFQFIGLSSIVNSLSAYKQSKLRALQPNVASLPWLYTSSKDSEWIPNPKRKSSSFLQPDPCECLSLATPHPYSVPGFADEKSHNRIIVFCALSIAHLPSYFRSPDPTYSGIPIAIYAFAEAHTSLVTATTPLLKSFVLEFGGVTAIPIVVVRKSQHGSNHTAKRPGPNLSSGCSKESDTTEHTGRSAASDLESGARQHSRSGTIPEYELCDTQIQLQSPPKANLPCSSEMDGQGGTLHSDRASTSASLKV